MTFAAHILTLYPDLFPGPLGHSLACWSRFGPICVGLAAENWTV